jgi:hypothetical protein
MPEYAIKEFGLMWSAQAHAGEVVLNLDSDERPEWKVRVPAAEFAALALVLQQPVRCVYDSDAQTIRTAWVTKP